eukprot:355184-Chlamydomonas_euryale.AAC.4
MGCKMSHLCMAAPSRKKHLHACTHAGVQPNGQGIWRLQRWHGRERAQHDGDGGDVGDLCEREQRLLPGRDGAGVRKP